MKRLATVGALLLSMFAMSVPAMPVNAESAPYEPELVAHEVTAPTSPQNSGPSGLPAPYSGISWGLDRIDQRGNTLDGLYSFSGSGAGVKVYVVDSGVNSVHREFSTSTRVVSGWSYRADSASLAAYKEATTLGADSKITIEPCPSNASGANTHQFDPPYSFDAPATVDGTDVGQTDNDGHGTHVAGIIGGEYTGVAKGVTIVPVRVLDSCGSGTTTMIRKGLEWIRSNHVAGQPAVVNMSVGFAVASDTIDLAITNLISDGVPVIAAAGNEATTSCRTTPAGTTGTISVGAISSNSSEAYYSNFGECVDIFAPGTDIISSWPKVGASTNNYTYYSETGTSMAAPHVTGVVALRLQGTTTTSNTPGEIWNWMLLNSSCDVVTYYDTNRGAAAQTANRVLNNGSAAGPACKPTTVTATVANAATTVTWTAPASPNGSALTGYTATLSPGGATCNTNASTLTCSFSGLTNNTTYTASVRGVNAIGTSVQAATVNVTPIGVPLPVTSLVAGVGNNSLVMTWNQQAGDGSGITYVATATPGNASCTVVNLNTCTITGLTNGVSYTVSVVGTNSLGSAAAVTATATPDGPPASPTNVTTTMASNSITLFWPAITSTLSVQYKVTASPGGATCITAQTQCTMIGLKNGVAYTFTVVTIAPNGKVSASSIFSARPGFTVLLTTVKKKSKTTLSKIVTSASTGRKTWSETGLCSIVSGKLVAPARTAKCKLILKVAKSSKYPAMSTTVYVTVK